MRALRVAASLGLITLALVLAALGFLSSAEAFRGPMPRGVVQYSGTIAGDVSPDSGTPDSGVDGGAALLSARTLFSGHSLHDTPLTAYYCGLAGEDGTTCSTAQQLRLGSPLRVRSAGCEPPDCSFSTDTWPGYFNAALNGIDVIATLGAGDVTHAVLTENHRLVGVLRGENTISYLRHYAERVWEGRSDAVVLYYTSWAGNWEFDSVGSATEIDDWVAYERLALLGWRCEAAKINLALADASFPAGQRIRMLAVNAGLADYVEEAVAGNIAGLAGDAHTVWTALFSDNVHYHATASPAALFVAAMTYATVYQRSPATSYAPAGVDAGLAAATIAYATERAAHYLAQTAVDPTMAECRAGTSAICAPYYQAFADEAGGTAEADCNTLFTSAVEGAGVWVHPDSTQVVYGWAYADSGVHDDAGPDGGVDSGVHDDAAVDAGGGGGPTPIAIEFEAASADCTGEYPGMASQGGDCDTAGPFGEHALLGDFLTTIGDTQLQALDAAGDLWVYFVVALDWPSGGTLIWQMGDFATVNPESYPNRRPQVQFNNNGQLKVTCDESHSGTWPYGDGALALDGSWQSVTVRITDTTVEAWVRPVDASGNPTVAIDLGAPTDSDDCTSFWGTPVPLTGHSYRNYIYGGAVDSRVDRLRLGNAETDLPQVAP